MDEPKKASHHKKVETHVLRTGRKVDDPPDYLGLVGKMCYQKIVQDLTEMGIIDGADSRAIEAYAGAYEEYRKARKVCLDEGFSYTATNTSGEEREAKRPESEVMASAWTRMRSLLPDLYLTPSTRLKAPGAGKDAKVDPFAEFLT